MLDLRTLFKNHFDTVKVSDDALRKFAQDHVARLTSNNQNGDYARMLTGTDAAYKNYCIAIDTEDANFATQQGSTMDVDKIMEEFKKSVSRYEGAVRAQYGIGASEYQQFFPNGLTEYAQASKTNIEMLMGRLSTMFNKYAADFNPNVVNLFAQYEQNYDTARNQQLVYLGNTIMYKSQTAQARTRLELVLAQNLLTIAAQFIGNPQMLNVFFDQSIVQSNKTKPNGFVQEEIAPSAVVNVEHKGIDENSEIQLANVGDTTLFVGIYEDAVSFDETRAVKLLPNESKTLSSSELGDPNNTYLNIKNASPHTQGKLQYAII